MVALFDVLTDAERRTLGGALDKLSTVIEADNRSTRALGGARGSEAGSAA
jgi:hypothetical protein